MKRALKLLAFLVALISLFQVVGCTKTFKYDDLERPTSIRMPGATNSVPEPK